MAGQPYLGRGPRPKKERLRVSLPVHLIEAIHRHIEQHPWKTESSVVSEAVDALVKREREQGHIP
jgi:Arc/MetJ-type ribon-helix-helix transcriptional regulator